MQKQDYSIGYVEGLKKALELVDERARFGVDKLVAGLCEEIKKKEQNDKKTS